MKSIEFNQNEIPQFNERLLLLSEQYQFACILDSNSYSESINSGYDLIAGFGANAIIKSDSFKELEEAYKKNVWLFGFLSYDLKNDLENLTSANNDGLCFPGLSFFEPEIRVEVNQSLVRIEGLGCREFRKSLEKINVHFSDFSVSKIKRKITKREYLDSVIKLKEYIQLGDIFEVNFCQEFFVENDFLDPLSAYNQLMKKSPVPFACFLKNENQYVMGASPERFLRRSGTKITSQPIKGTSKRGITKDEDENQINQLKESIKERSENVMIVDLVRNDFSKVADKGSVKVEELFGIYTFPQVHQMISTVSCNTRPDLSSIEIIKQCFPMGSMTGAPKIRAMKLIEKYESSKRGLFSGAIGYIKPNGDFDFNVVIRSILYNKKNRYISFMVGGAITIGSDPEAEYDEAILKAEAIFEILTKKID
mgnify:CR=1 FL=1